jgi:NADPH:quinone reductase-like Zn-dependent oxidoreductase
VKLRNKILLGIGAVLLVGTSALMATLSYESACPQAPALPAGTDSMRAITHRCYGPPGKVLSLEQIAKPKPGEHELLIKLHAASINPYEWHMVTGKPYFMRFSTGIGAPHRSHVGYDMAGTIEAVGTKVTRFKVGDEVFGGANGALAEYALASDDGDVVAKPADVPFEDAASLLIAGGTALEAVRDHGRVAAGQKVLINGASGGVGTYAIQLAKLFGAEVTAVCSTRNVELVRSLGADHVIDYTHENFTKGLEQSDVVIDNVGNQPYHDLLDVVKPQGIVVTISGPKDNAFLGPISRIIKQKAVSYFVDQHLEFFVANANPKDLEYLVGLLRDGKMKTVIDRRYPLAQAGAALDYVGSQHSRGKVIVTM